VRAIDVHPGDAAAYRRLGNFYYATGSFGKAADQYTYSVALEPHDMAGYSNLGAARMMSGNFEGALKAYEQAINLSPTGVAYSNLGLMYFYLGDLDAAIENLTAAVELGSNKHLNWSNLGDALWVAGRTDEATNAYSKARELATEAFGVNPNDPETTIDLAWINANLGAHDEARALMDKGRTLAPDDPYTWYYDALVMLRAGDTDGAMAALEKAAAAGYSLKLLAADPLLAELRDNPRYVTVVEER
jgi:serine/threonine-protein kinase